MSRRGGERRGVVTAPGVNDGTAAMAIGIRRNGGFGLSKDLQGSVNE
jgi:hypothetical protein